MLMIVNQNLEIVESYQGMCVYIYVHIGIYNTHIYVLSHILHMYINIPLNKSLVG